MKLKCIKRSEVGERSPEAKVIRCELWLPYVRPARVYLARRYSDGVTMRVPLYEPRVSKSLSPAINKSAFARALHSRNISSPGSRHSFTVPRILTRMPRARITCSANTARCCSQRTFPSGRARSPRQSHRRLQSRPRSSLFRAPESACHDVSQTEERKSRRLCR